MENNDYYEPTIKTSRVDEITKEQALKLLDTITKDRNNLKNEKQQLISFLEENIRNRLDTVEFYENQDIQSTKEELEKTVSRLLAELNAYQEVLDFVENGGKDE